MAKPRPLPARFTGVAFTRRDALDAGIPDRRLRARDLEAPFHGVRMPAAGNPSLLRLASAYQQRMPSHHAFSHATAAKLHGVPLPRRFGDLPLDVSCASPHRAPQGRHVRGHRLRREVWDCEHLLVPAYDDGGPFELRLTRATLTWLLLARELDLTDLVAAGDALVSSGSTSVEALRTASDVWASGHGARRLFEALPLIRVGPMSRPESLLRVLIVRAGLPEPEVNVPVFDGAGRHVFRPDLSWPDQRVLVEYEGDLHRVSRAKFRSDIHRMEAFTDAGWSGMRAVADDVFVDPDRFLARLQRRLVGRGLRPSRLRQVAACQP